ncbi:uncharacterized protein SETTUDRAFT_92003 [Exserohilum turcica Et28A]|uniref:Uncharacterized protein n=1 Tax=Exserohilum turcicum (strain 28A) TaxID=671987 RepID=R0JU90_EXST2|nr:uncharacterized protein SETTUDRAFT_92003 [Exserohilum turcica Et28A]EOA84588.1 hypothetical protein SETTUDRAFT_92003 [Exserohilum turcica Et28A]
MLARANSDAGARLRRSKSASTVHKRPVSTIESIDLEAVRQQAVAAATAAFSRAQVQDASDRTARYSSDVSRSKSNASRKSLTAQGSHFPPREGSFRAMQRPKMEHSKSSQRLSQASTVNMEHNKPTIGGSLSVQRQLSAQPSVTFNENVRPSSQPKNPRSSAASSVTSQQIRKARSMYYASSIQTGSPIARPPAKYLATPSSASTSPVSEPSPIHPLPRSLRPSPLAAPRIPVTVAAGVTLDQARDDYLQEFQQKSVKPKPSIFLAPFKKRQDKGKEKARRSVTDTQAFPVSDGQGPDDSTTDITLSEFMPPQELKERRSFSGSLKNKIMKVFRRTSIKPTNLPVQHIAASRDYFSTSHVRPPSDNDATSIPCPDEATLQRVRERTPSHEGVHPACLRSGSRSNSAGSGRSGRSLHSEANAPHVPASRMTSWGTTTTTDTLAQRAIKRMTVIHESKDSIGSEADQITSVTATRRKSLPLPPLSSFRDPMPMQSLEEENSTPIDPKRVFSALMKEIGTTRSSEESASPTKRTPGAESDVFESRKTKLQSQTRDLHSSGSHIRSSIELDFRPPSRRPPTAQSAQSKTSTIRSLGRAIRSTIRTVTPAGQPSSPDPDIRNCAPERGHRNDLAPHSNSTPETEGSEGEHVGKRKYVTQIFAPSASQIEKRMDKSRDRWKNPLEQPENPQFPRETDKSCDVTTLAEESHEILEESAEMDGSGQHVYDISGQDSRKHAKSPNPCRSPGSKDVITPMSPSIYSRNTDGISIDHNDSIISFDGTGQFEQAHHAGSAVILTSQSVRSYVVGTPSPQREAPARTSRDWRAWLSHEISGMELNSQEDLSINEHFANISRTKRSGSVRTSHTEHEDTTVVLRGSLDQYDDEALGPRTSYRNEHLGEVKDCEGDNREVTGKFQEQDSHPTASNANESKRDSGSGINVCPTSKSRPASFASGNRRLSIPGVHASQSLVGSETSKPPAMNERFPLANTDQHPSSNSLVSLYSKSVANSTSSLPSLKPSKPSVGRANLSTAAPNESSQHIPSTAAPKRSDAQHHRKENITPQSLRSTKQYSTPTPHFPSPLVPSQPLQHCSPRRHFASSSPQRKSPSATTTTTTPTRLTPTRPRIRAVIRPKSAFDLCNTTTTTTTTAALQYNNPGINATPESPLRRPRSYARDPHTLPPHNEAGAADTLQGRASVTPGHRLADEFLRERKSGIGAEKLRGGLVLVREDTPAFL